MSFFDMNKGTGSLTDINTSLKALTQNVGQLNNTIQNVVPRITGTFTMAAAATKTVTNTLVHANSIVFLTPTNAAAATLMAGAHSLYISAVTAGASFTVATADSGSAAGTETFQYFAVTPV